MSKNIRIRMYHVGFGDCILVTFPEDRHMLVDCGVHWLGDLRRIRNAVANIAEVTKGHPNVVVATHRHVDHLSGFDTESEAFAAMKADEVWLPFGMNKDDPAGKALTAWEKHLVRAFAAYGSEKGTELSLLAASNNRATETLTKLATRKENLRWMPEELEILKTEALPDADIQVLGPRRDNKYSSIGDPQHGDAYLCDLEDVAMGERESPFDDRWYLSGEDARVYFPGLKPEGLPRREDILDDLLAATGALINNSSICFTLRYGDALMLFPGDTQYGGWRSIFESTDMDSQLKSITFLKVSHHGSHNGTPKSLIDPMKKFVSIVSTKPVEQWPDIPREPLLEALGQRGPVVRSDRPPGRKMDYRGLCSIVPGEFWTDILLRY